MFECTSTLGTRPDAIAHMSTFQLASKRVDRWSEQLWLSTPIPVPRTGICRASPQCAISSETVHLWISF
jgi:hypothetical protein